MLRLIAGLAWKQSLGIKIVDSRSDFRQKMLQVNPKRHRSMTSLLSFGHIDSQDNQLLASAEGECISIHLWKYSDQETKQPDVLDGVVLKTISGHQVR